MRTSVEGYTFIEKNSSYCVLARSIIVRRVLECSISSNCRSVKGGRLLVRYSHRFNPSVRRALLSKEISYHIHPLALEICFLPCQIHLQIFSNTATLICEPCRRLCARDGSYPPPPLTNYGITFLDVSTYLDIRKMAIRTSVMTCVCDFSAVFHANHRPLD